MVRLIAAFGCSLLIALLFRLNRDKEVRTSKAIWIPTLWLFIASTRSVGEWLHFDPGAQSNRYLDGNPLDRAILSALLGLALLVLISRGRQVAVLLRTNLPILLFFLYCGISIVWSDYPDVSFKRWFRAVGDFAMILVLLTDPDWFAAVRRLLSRIAFVVMPVSILFIRYIPELGRTYSRGGAAAWTGVATDKNALGMICLIFGLSAVYRFLQLRKERGENGDRKKGQVIAQGMLMVMTVYLLWMANSATSLACFLLAGGVMVLTQLVPWARKPTNLNFMVAAAVFVPMSAMFLGIGSSLVGTLGRDTTFTGRTAIWQAALGLVTNPILGAGYESFWLGPRLLAVESQIAQGVNQAHNGYIEIYLNLGWVGVALLGLLLVTGYRRIAPAVISQTQMGSLRMAFFVVAVAYDFSEFGFKMMHPVWLTFLLATSITPAILVREAQESEARSPEPEFAPKLPGRLPIPARPNRPKTLPRLAPRKSW